MHDVAVNEWTDASKDDHQTDDDVEMSLFYDMKITYQTGKGSNHIVPVLIPQHLIKAMEMLNDQSIRESSGIRTGNPYVFPSIQSDSHVSGWHAVHRVCSDAQVESPERMTATKMRHRISTLYAALGVSENDRMIFYKHIGHSADVNKNIYQTPLA